MVVGVVGLLIILLVVGLLTGGGGGSSKHTESTASAAAAQRAMPITPPGGPRLPPPRARASLTLSLRPTAAVYVCLIGENGRKLIPGTELQPGDEHPDLSRQAL